MVACWLFQLEGLRLRAIGRIKSLTFLNGERVTDTESAAALRLAAGSRISQVDYPVEIIKPFH